MKKKRFSVEPIVGVLKQADIGVLANSLTTQNLVCWTVAEYGRDSINALRMD